MNPELKFRPESLDNAVSGFIREHCTEVLIDESDLMVQIRFKTLGRRITNALRAGEFDLKLIGSPCAIIEIYGCRYVSDRIRFSSQGFESTMIFEFDGAEYLEDLSDPGDDE